MTVPSLRDLRGIALPAAPRVPIVVVCGPPASGKSTLAAAIADSATVPLLAKDAIKETLFDALGAGDREWSERLGRACYPLLYQWLTSQLAAGKPVVVEGTFVAVFANREFRAVNEQHPFDALQVYVTASPEVLLTRYAARAATRHPGHADGEADTVERIAEGVREGNWQPLDLAGRSITVNTTDLETVDATGLVLACCRHLSGAQRDA